MSGQLKISANSRTSLLLRHFILLMASLCFIPVLLTSCQKPSDKGPKNQEKTLALRKFLENDSLMQQNTAFVKDSVMKIIAEGERAGDWNLLANALQRMAAIHFISNRHDSALFFLEQIKFFEDKITDTIVLYNCLIEFGKNLHYPGYIDSASHYFERAAQLAENSNNVKLKMGAANHLAMIKSDLGLKAEAYNHYLKALAYADSLGDIQNKSIVLNNLGLIDTESGRIDLAEQRFREAIAINKTKGHWSNLTMLYGNLALVFDKKNMPDSVLYYNNLVLNISRERGLRRDVARALNNSAEALLMMGRLDEAEKYFSEAQEISRADNLIIGLYYTGIGLTKVAIEKGKHSEALHRLNKAYEAAQLIGDIGMLKEVLHLHAQTYHKLGDYRQAYDYLVEFQKINDSLLVLANQNHIEELRAKYESEKKELENERLRTENFVQKTNVRQLTIIIILVGMGMFSLIIFAVVLNRNRRKIQKLYNQLSLLNKEVHAKNEELLLANQTKDKLFSLIAHDLKSPFNALMGILAILVEEKNNIDEQERQQLLENLYKQTLTTYGTLENLLQWSMSQRQMFIYTPTEYSLKESINREVEAASGRAKQKNITIDNLLPEMTINSDEQLVQNISRNIINNAVKFSQTNSTIRIMLTQRNGRTAIAFADEGIGMSFEQLSKARDGIQMESSRGTADERGTGLGIQMIGEFARLIGGQIEFESTEGKGTTVYLILPESSFPTNKPNDI